MQLKESATDLLAYGEVLGITGVFVISSGEVEVSTLHHGGKGIGEAHAHLIHRLLHEELAKRDACDANEEVAGSVPRNVHSEVALPRHPPPSPRLRQRCGRRGRRVGSLHRWGDEMLVRLLGKPVLHLLQLLLSLLLLLNAGHVVHEGRRGGRRR